MPDQLKHQAIILAPADLMTWFSINVSKPTTGASRIGDASIHRDIAS